jgi:TROVE domain
MANRTLFRSLVGALLPKADARNEEGGAAYARPPRQALAQYAATGCLNTTFYANAGEQLDRVLDLCTHVTPEFVAKTAVYSRERGHLKDMPALLLAILSRRDPALMDRVFDRVIDTPRMLRTFVQIVRSGTTGRKSLGSAPKRCVRRWLDRQTDAALFAASVGNAPSLVDILRMVHPKPATPSREALYGYLAGREIANDLLPPVVRDFEAFKAGNRLELPDVPFQMLTAVGLSRNEWCEVARRGSWQMTRMNLNAFARHGVFDRADVADRIAARLRDASAIKKARVFPYQLLAAYRSANPAVPGAVRRALEDAMELAVANVPRIDGHVYVCPDVSGSMQSPITGQSRWIDDSGAVRRRRRACDGVTGPAQPGDGSAAVRTVRCPAAPLGTRQRADERGEAGVGRRRRNVGQRAARVAEFTKGDGRSDPHRVRQPVVGRHGVEWNGDTARVECVPQPEPASAAGAARPAAVLDDASVGTRGHFEHRWILRSRLRRGGGLRDGTPAWRPLGVVDRVRGIVRSG